MEAQAGPITIPPSPSAAPQGEYDAGLMSSPAGASPVAASRPVAIASSPAHELAAGTAPGAPYPGSPGGGSPLKSSPPSGSPLVGSAPSPNLSPTLAPRRRGRPRKGEEMTEEERKARRKEINRLAARRAHQKKLDILSKLESENKTLKAQLHSTNAQIRQYESMLVWCGIDVSKLDLEQMKWEPGPLDPVGPPTAPGPLAPPTAPTT